VDRKALSNFVDFKRPCRVSGSCAVAGFGVSDAEPLDAARNELDNHRGACRPENFRFNSLVAETQRGTSRAATLQRNSTCCVTYMPL